MSWGQECPRSSAVSALCRKGQGQSSPSLVGDGHSWLGSLKGFSTVKVTVHLLYFSFLSFLILTEYASYVYIHSEISAADS